MADDKEVVEEKPEVLQVGSGEPEVLQVGSGELDVGLSPIEANPEKPLAPPKYRVRPGLGEKFQRENVREIILSSMQEQLLGRQYQADQAQRWAQAISTTIRHRVQALDMKRYKILVQTKLFEKRGAGIISAMRCIWDPETDDFADNSFRSDTILCHTIVYGVFIY